MDHIELYVSNLQQTKVFYSKFLVQLGFELFQEWEEGFSYKKESFYIVFVQVKEKYQSTNYHRCYVGLNHLAFSCSDKTIITKIREQFPHDYSLEKTVYCYVSEYNTRFSQRIHKGFGQVTFELEALLAQKQSVKRSQMTLKKNETHVS